MHVDRKLAAVAARQKGLVTIEQMGALGLGRGAIDWRIRTGRLHRMFRGVYLLGHPIAPPFARELGATLAVGEHSLVSHRPALVLWGLLEPVDGDVDVTVVGRTRHNRSGITVHGTEDLPQRDRARRHGVPVTSARALLDYAATANPSELARAFDEALIQKRTSRVRLRELLENGSSGRRGARALAALLDRAEPPAFTRSTGERRMLALIRAGGLPEPRVNSRVLGHELDFYWPEERLDVELDAWEVHRGRVARDHARDAALQSAGIRVVRVTGDELAHAAEAVLVRIARALSPGFAPRSAGAL